MKRISKKPLGQVTRGKTARNRLRRVDNWLMMYEPLLLRRSDGAYEKAWFVDLGYGAEPFTTLESAQRLRRVSPALNVLGVEIDPERVQTALPYADAQTQFRLGGFNLPLQAGESVKLIRAFNVLRQYDETQVNEAHATLMEQVLPGGLLIEGTSDPYGRVWVANVLRRTASRRKRHLPGRACCSAPIFTPVSTRPCSSRCCRKTTSTICCQARQFTNLWKPGKPLQGRRLPCGRWVCASGLRLPPATCTSAATIWICGSGSCVWDTCSGAGYEQTKLAMRRKSAVTLGRRTWDNPGGAGTVKWTEETGLAPIGSVRT